MTNPRHDAHNNSPEEGAGEAVEHPVDAGRRGAALSDETPPPPHLRVDLAFPTRDLPLPGNADDD